ncbi:Oidioi.mRNA.OKI2018_I69.chr1.g113.t1.cds [Oikopleura dioica]|uniref:Oidioi.mRNA.OKI2018_I69.chr1.g113.t1.cds n=1 Tax=Oikopleura dioica TaxID=34765 RepID=A0ABN7SIU7_OIKDI|nr:Oidioi.mRNA.OKI2018_I69.chr1.g113.t1.cds [Oikopleura dioica]
MVEVKKSRRNSKFLSPIDKSSQSLTRSQSRSTLLGSAQGSRVPKPPTEQKINPRIKPIYENGKEITPKPLFLIDASSTHPRLRLEDGKTVPNFQSMMTSMTGTFGGNLGATTRGTSVTLGRSFLERSTKSGIDTDLLRSEAPEDEDVASPFQQNQSRSVAFVGLPD